MPLFPAGPNAPDVPTPDRASLLFLADESRRIVRLQFEAGNELAGKAEAIVKFNGLFFGLLLTALGLASKFRLAVPGLGPSWLGWAVLAAGPGLLFVSMLCGVWAFKSVDFEIGLSEQGMLQALRLPLKEPQMLRKAVQAYAKGIEANKASINKVEVLISVGLLAMALGAALVLTGGLITWISNGGLHD
ncbi:MAG: hypothetical protein QOD77_211 [Thermoplasmata archaeon]|jgi:uncharacterized membrane protein|nr:hypothetical protein [Thermoplasmata archaeon]